MRGGREAFLQTVRRAVAEGNRAGQNQEPKRNDGVGYQGGGDDPVTCFLTNLAAAGGQGHIVRSADEAKKKTVELACAVQARQVLLGGHHSLPVADLSEDFLRAEIQVWEEPEDIDPSDKVVKDILFRADVGITGVDYLIAETGSVVQFSKLGQCRSLSLLPAVHIAIAKRSQLVPDLFDLFSKIETERRVGEFIDLPACVTLITGPSKTGDIELRLVTGVHGPGQVHVVLIDGM